MNRQETIIKNLSISPQPLKESREAIELILEGLQMLGENRDVTALLQVVGQANSQVQQIMKEQAIENRRAS